MLVFFLFTALLVADLAAQGLPTILWCLGVSEPVVRIDIILCLAKMAMAARAWPIGVKNEALE